MGVPIALQGKPRADKKGGGRGCMKTRVAKKSDYGEKKCKKIKDENGRHHEI